MKTTTLDVGGMLSVLDCQGVERQLARMPGVHRATSSVASNSVTVEYDEAITCVAALGEKVKECGFHCTGQIMPRHVCEPHPGRAGEARQADTPAAATPAMPMPHDMAHE